MENPAITVGYKGDDSNDVYRQFIGGEEPLSLEPARIPLTSCLCNQIHFSLDQYRFWVKLMKDRPKYMRKQWEFFYIAQILHERGFLKQGSKGLAFGVGREPLPALFASFGCEVLATDQSIESAVQAGWVRSNEHATDLSGLNDRSICASQIFSELVKFEALDMNAISSEFDGRFDFCWSACALEHLGSLRHGIDFILNSTRTLRPGGIAVHTAEYNLSSNDATIESQNLSIYRRRDIEALAAYLDGVDCDLEPIDFSQGCGFVDQVVDLPPFGRGEPHIRIRLGEFECTSIGLIVIKRTPKGFAANRLKRWRRFWLGKLRLNGHPAEHPKDFL